jgi:hypothetical protein
MVPLLPVDSTLVSMGPQVDQRRVSGFDSSERKVS